MFDNYVFGCEIDILAGLVPEEVGPKKLKTREGWSNEIGYNVGKDINEVRLNLRQD